MVIRIRPWRLIVHLGIDENYELGQCITISPNHTKFRPNYLSFYANLKLKFHALKLPTATTFWYQNVPWTLKFMFQLMNFCIHLYFAKQNKHKLFVAMKIAGCSLNHNKLWRNYWTYAKCDRFIEFLVEFCIG